MFNLSDMELSMLTLLMSSIVITIIGYSAHKSELVNPITAFVFTNLVGMGLLSTYAAWYNENIFDCSESQLSDAVWVHLIYGLAFVFGYLSRYNLISFVLRNLISFFSILKEENCDFIDELIILEIESKSFLYKFIHFICRAYCIPISS